MMGMWRLHIPLIGSRAVGLRKESIYKSAVAGWESPEMPKPKSKKKKDAAS